MKKKPEQIQLLLQQLHDSMNFGESKEASLSKCKNNFKHIILYYAPKIFRHVFLTDDKIILIK